MRMFPICAIYPVPFVLLHNQHDCLVHILRCFARMQNNVCAPDRTPDHKNQYSINKINQV